MEYEWNWKDAYYFHIVKDIKNSTAAVTFDDFYYRMGMDLNGSLLAKKVLSPPPTEVLQ